MKKTILFVTIISSVLLASACTNDYLSPRAGLDDGSTTYKINGKDVKLPAFVSLPADKSSISLTFEKPNSDPVTLDLVQTIDGWEAPNGKILADILSDAGVVIDFNDEGIYEIPEDDLNKLKQLFTANDEIVVNATTGNSKNAPKLVIADSQGMFNADELRYLTQLNSELVVLPENIPNINDSNNLFNTGLDSVVVNRPIISAAMNDQYDRLNKELNNKGNINEKDAATGDNALMKTIQQGDVPMSNYLMDRGINTRATNNSGQNALHMSADLGMYDIANRLIKDGNNVNAKDNAGNTPLMYASVAPSANVVDLLINNGARVNEKNSDGQSPLMLASQVGNTNTVETLVKNGADLNAVDGDGNSALMYAVENDNDFTTNELIELGADVDMPNNRGYRPLNKAIDNNNIAIVNKLLTSGANVNTKDPLGNTPLINAVAKGDMPMVDAIMQYEPNVNVKNNLDETAYSIAEEKGYDAIRRSLSEPLEAVDNAARLLFDSVAKNDIPNAEKALKDGAKINVLDTNTGNTALFTSVANNLKPMTTFLLDNGADVNIRNNKGNTPLIVAVTASDMEMFNMLLKTKPAVDIKNLNGDTALIWATKLKKIDMVRALILAGANPNLKNNDGISAFLIASNEGTPEILALLQAAGGYR